MRMPVNGPSASVTDFALRQAVAADGYRNWRLSEHQVKEMLGFESRFDVHDWLREREIPYQYTEEDLRRDVETLRKLGF